jgi:hypothetical protein
MQLNAFTVYKLGDSNWETSRGVDALILCSNFEGRRALSIGRFGGGLKVWFNEWQHSHETTFAFGRAPSFFGTVLCRQMRLHRHDYLIYELQYRNTPYIGLLFSSFLILLFGEPLFFDGALIHME